MPDPIDFALPVQFLDDWAVVRLPAEIDVVNVSSVSDVLLIVLNRGIPGVIADMTDTSFCGAAGVRAIVHARKRAQALGASFRVVAPHLSVRRVFMLTGGEQAIRSYASVDEALASPRRDSGGPQGAASHSQDQQAARGPGDVRTT